jgi:hypothetical protein
MMTLIAGYVMGKRTVAKAVRMNTVSSSASLEAWADVDARVDRMMLVIEAMWSILKEEGYTDDQLAARIEELDTSDGVEDGRRIPPAVTCRSCGSKVMIGIPRCQTCGTETGAVAGPLDGL